eukprot:8403253-Alexandrium_andersonii.AAC.1
MSGKCLEAFLEAFTALEHKYAFTRMRRLSVRSYDSVCSGVGFVFKRHARLHAHSVPSGVLRH